MHVHLWSTTGDMLQVEPESYKPGDPCLLIPANKDAVWQWIHALMEAVESGDMDRDLPGTFSEIPEEA